MPRVHGLRLHQAQVKGGGEDEDEVCCCSTTWNQEEEPLTATAFVKQNIGGKHPESEKLTDCVDKCCQEQVGHFEFSLQGENTYEILLFLASRCHVSQRAAPVSEARLSFTIGGSGAKLMGQKGV